MNSIAVWYHCKVRGTGIPDTPFALAIVSEQMQALSASGLAESAHEIHLCVNGPESDGLMLSKLVGFEATVHVHGASSITELPTLSLLRKWLPQHKDWFVCYHHSKGVTQLEQGRRDIEGKAKHRRLMEKAVIWNWRKCVADLEKGFDCVGINYVDPITRPVLPGRFYAGNFWWARADFLIRIPPIPDTAIDFSVQQRCQAETWIGRGKFRPKALDYERPELSSWCGLTP